jgi:hypothetical protein
LICNGVSYFANLLKRDNSIIQHCNFARGYSGYVPSIQECEPYYKVLNNIFIQNNFKLEGKDKISLGMIDKLER